MNSSLIIEKNFKNLNFSKNRLEIADYEDCIFENCNFTNTSLSTYSFTDCEFINCDLSMVKVKNTSFKEVSFIDCKLLGVLFYECNKFLLSFNFKQCNISYASFVKLDLKKQLFNKCILKEVDFSFTDLQESCFDTCDLSNAVFHNTILVKANFRTAKHYTIDPENNKIKNAKFSLANVSGLLDKYHIKIEIS